MHICFITHEYPKIGKTQGGIGSVVQTIGHALVAKGINVSVVGVGGVDSIEKENDNGVFVYRLPGSVLPIGRFIVNAFRLRRQLQKIHAENPIDIVEGSELSFAFFPKNYFAKKVIRMHGGHHFFAVTLGNRPSPWRSYQEIRSFKRADAFIAVSDFVSKTTKRLLNLESPVKTIYNMVDTKKFYLANTSKIISHKIVFVGTVTEKKGIRQFVQAMPEILNRFPDATLEIIGRDWIDPVNGGSYMEYLKTFIGEKIKESIHLLGPLPHHEIPLHLETAEVCVYPSHMEAQGLVVVEAMSMGKAIIFSNTGPGPEAVRDHQTGLLCDPFDPSDIASKVIYMFSHPDLAKRMGTQARKDVLERFDMEKTIQANIEFYRSVL